MSTKKTAKTDNSTPETEEKVEATSTEAEPLIIDVTPQRTSSGKGVGYAALILATVGLGLGGFATFKLAEETSLASRVVPSYPAEMDAEYTQLLETYREEVQADVESLHQMFDDLSQRINGIEELAIAGTGNTTTSTANGTAELTEELASLRNELAEVESRLAELDSAEPRDAAADLSLEEAEALLLKLRYQRAADALVAARSQNAAQLKTLLGTLTSLDAENTALQGAINALVPRASALFTQPAVKRDFAAAADEALAIRVEGEGWWQQQVNQLAKLVKVRKVEADEDSIAAKINRAEAALNKGNTAHAVTAIQSLTAPASGYFKDWLPKATAYGKAQAAYRALLDQLRNPTENTPSEATAAPTNIEFPTVSVDYDTPQNIAPASETDALIDGIEEVTGATIPEAQTPTEPDLPTALTSEE